MLVEKTEWGVEYTFECIGNVDVMRSALEAAHRCAGQPTGFWMMTLTLNHLARHIHRTYN